MTIKDIPNTPLSEIWDAVSVFATAYFIFFGIVFVFVIAFFIYVFRFILKEQRDFEKRRWKR